MTEKNTIIILLIGTAAMILLGVLVVSVYRLFVSQIDKRTLQYQSELLERHCQEVENMYRQARGWRHDYHNHIQTMKAHLAMGKLEELEKYLNELDTDLTAVDTIIKTGNVMIDAVLNSKISLARAKGITVKAKALVPKNLNTSVRELDICLIIGNLMDNAIEACLKIQEPDNRFIRVYIDILRGQLYLYILNAVGDSPRRKGHGYVSGKGGRYHGFGLMRIDQVVERYQGYLERQDEEGVFATEIMLPLAH